jgi:bacterioferritin (cytochrome b1)
MSAARGWPVLLRCQQLRETRRRRAHLDAAAQWRRAQEAHQAALEHERQARQRHREALEAAHAALAGKVVDVSALWDLHGDEQSLALAIAQAAARSRETADLLEAALAMERQTAAALQAAMRLSARRQEMWRRHRERQRAVLERREDAAGEDWLDQAARWRQ